jgi:nudix-type nucleoside diphosphatase (YffH/AdpP family)
MLALYYKDCPLNIVLIEGPHRLYTGKTAMVHEWGQRPAQDVLQMDDIEGRVRLRDLTVLSVFHYILRRARFAWRRADGRWQDQMRESYDIGDGAAVLPIDRARGLVILVRQFRWPVYEAGEQRLTIEAPAGKLDGNDPEACVRREALEEAGVTLGVVRPLFHCFSSPGALKERLTLFLSDYDSTAPRARGGGLQGEGEDISVLEIPLVEAHAMMGDGRIDDAKTMLLIQAALLETRR